MNPIPYEQNMRETEATSQLGSAKGLQQQQQRYTSPTASSARNRATFSTQRTALPVLPEDRPSSLLLLIRPSSSGESKSKFPSIGSPEAPTSGFSNLTRLTLPSHQTARTVSGLNLPALKDTKLRNETTIPITTLSPRPQLLKTWSYSSVTTMKRRPDGFSTLESGQTTPTGVGASNTAPSGKLRHVTSVSFLPTPPSLSGSTPPLSLIHQRRNSEFTRYSSSASHQLSQHQWKLLSSSTPSPPMVQMSPSSSVNSNPDSPSQFATPPLQPSGASTPQSLPRTTPSLPRSSSSSSLHAAARKANTGITKPNSSSIYQRRQSGGIASVIITKRPASDQSTRLASPLSREVSPVHSPEEPNIPIRPTLLHSPHALAPNKSSTLAGSVVRRHHTLRTSTTGSSSTHHSNSTMSSLESNEVGSSNNNTTESRLPPASDPPAASSNRGTKSRGRKSYPLTVRTRSSIPSPVIPSSPTEIHQPSINSVGGRESGTQPTSLLRPTKSNIFRSKIANTLRSIGASSDKNNKSNSSRLVGARNSLLGSMIGRSRLHGSATVAMGRSTSGGNPETTSYNNIPSKVRSPPPSAPPMYPRAPTAAKFSGKQQQQQHHHHQVIGNSNSVNSISSIPRLAHTKSSGLIPRPINTSIGGSGILRKADSVASMTRKTNSQLSSPRSPMYRKAFIHSSPTETLPPRKKNEMEEWLMLRPVETPDIVPRTFSPRDLDRAMTPTLKTVYTSPPNMNSPMGIEGNIDPIASLIPPPAPAALSPINTWLANSTWHSSSSSLMDAIPGSPEMSSEGSLKPVLKRTPLRSAVFPTEPKTRRRGI